MEINLGKLSRICIALAICVLALGCPNSDHSPGTTPDLNDSAVGTGLGRGSEGAGGNAGLGRGRGTGDAGGTVGAGGTGTGGTTGAAGTTSTTTALPGVFAMTGRMTVAREEHTATLLPNGKVLIAGGNGLAAGAGTVLASAELYDPAVGTFTATGSMAEARMDHTATLLPNGKVLITGGLDGEWYANGQTVASAELYDPAVGTFTATGSMAEARMDHTATLLPGGKVLIAGGGSEGSIQTFGAELYDPAAGTFAASGNMIVTRESHTATLLPSGDVLIAGGESAPSFAPLAEAELYEYVEHDSGDGTSVATGSVKTGSMAVARFDHTATLLPNGMVLIAGGHGRGADAIASAELYEQSGGTFAATGSITVAREWHTATLLDSGKVLIVGGVSNYNSESYLSSLASAELFDSAAGGFTATGSMAAARFHHTATLLTSGKVLIAGGLDDSGGILASAELYQ